MEITKSDGRMVSSGTPVGHHASESIAKSSRIPRSTCRSGPELLTRLSIFYYDNTGHLGYNPENVHIHSEIAHQQTRILTLPLPSHKRMEQSTRANHGSEAPCILGSTGFFLCEVGPSTPFGMLIIRSLTLDDTNIHANGMNQVLKVRYPTMFVSCGFNYRHFMKDNGLDARYTPSPTVGDYPWE